MLLCHIMYEQMNNPLLTRWVSARYICDETSTFVYQHLAMVYVHFPLYDSSLESERILNAVII